MCHRIARSLTAAGIALCALAAPSRAATAEETDVAVKKAVAFLLSHQDPAGNWEQVQKQDPAGGAADVKGKQWGGQTAIATYAILAAGEDPKSKALAKPIQFLKDASLNGIYATGLRCQVWPLLEDPDNIHPLLARDGKTLIEAVHPAGGAADKSSVGFYPYFYDKMPIDGWYDRSVSQYGVLGMWALADAGLEIPQKYWLLVDGAWRRAQNKDGGWKYRDDSEGTSTTTMTAAGIATLYITQDFTLGNLSECHGNITNPNIDAGLAWMDKHIHQALGGNYYGMYGIERIGVASGRKYFETVDWYKDGSEFIVRNQAADGSWGSIPDTCFALLFLVRGRAPVVMNKLEYYSLDKTGKVVEGPWNERPRDCANFVHWMGHNIEQHHLNWQIVNLKVAPEELHDSQVLYMTGNKELTFSTQETAKLRTYVEQGGLILGTADCGSPVFSKSFQALGNKLFPKYEFRELPANHPIFTDEQYPASKWHPRPKVLGLSNGVRELMVLIPEADPARAWQGRDEKHRADVYQLGADIFLYAVDRKNLQYKGATYIIAADPAVQTTRGITLGRLQVGDNSNPEPGGWPRMTALLHNQQKVALTVKPVTCDATSLKGLQILHLTGTTSFALTADQKKAIKDFVEGGGTFIVDSAGGSSLFTDSAEAELKALFGELQTLPLESPVYNLPDQKIDMVSVRTYARKSLSGPTRTPRVKAVSVKGRLAVFFSREDLSAGIVGEPMDGIVGYEPASATALMRNLIMFGAFGSPKPPARPATQPAAPPSTQPSTAPATQPAAPKPAPAPVSPVPAAPPAPAAPGATR